MWGAARARRRTIAKEILSKSSANMARTIRAAAIASLAAPAVDVHHRSQQLTSLKLQCRGCCRIIMLKSVSGRNTCYSALHDAEGQNDSVLAFACAIVVQSFQQLLEAHRSAFVSLSTPQTTAQIQIGAERKLPLQSHHRLPAEAPK